MTTIAAVLHTHGQPEVTLDTIESIMTYMTDKILLVIDEAGYEKFNEVSLPVPSLCGFYHGHHRAPYRNIALGLLNAYQKWPEVDWICYLEYDCLVGSSAFQQDLLQMNDAWIIGNDFRRNQEAKMPLIECMLKTSFKEVFYLLGAFLFYNKKFMKKLADENFLERLLFYTNDFKQGFFPGYTAWDLIEHLMPTLAKHWGGEIGQFAKWNGKACRWVDGNWRRYPIRWQPDLSLLEEYIQASLMHPLKTFDNHIRNFHRLKRRQIIQEKENAKRI